VNWASQLSPKCGSCPRKIVWAFKKVKTGLGGRKAYGREKQNSLPFFKKALESLNHKQKTKA
jgi:hypothetical protein